MHRQPLSTDPNRRSTEHLLKQVGSGLLSDRLPQLHGSWQSVNSSGGTLQNPSLGHACANLEYLKVGHVLLLRGTSKNLALAQPSRRDNHRMSKPKTPARSALKFDLFADAARKQKIQTLRDPLQVIARRIDFAHLS